MKIQNPKKMAEEELIIGSDTDASSIEGDDGELVEFVSGFLQPKKICNNLQEKMVGLRSLTTVC